MTGGIRKQKEKKVFFFKVYTKVECYFKKNWVLVFSFMCLVSVDPMDISIIILKGRIEEDVLLLKKPATL